MTKITFYIKKALLFLAFACLAYSCDEFKDNSSFDFTEGVKDIQGTWQIVKATRKGLDITTLMDFRKFELNLKEDKTYTINNYLPFVVKKGGTWNVDDPQYPFRLIFEEEASNKPLISTLSYPVTNGKRQIGLSFSPGCYSNIYTYVFEKVSN